MAKRKRNRGAEAVRFIPNKVDRFKVTLLTECGLSREMVARQIINPHTGEPISTRTLAEAFKTEIAEARSLLKLEAIKTVMTMMMSQEVNGVPVEHATRLRAAMFYLNTQGGWAHQAAIKPQRIDHFHTHEHSLRVKEIDDKLRDIFGDDLEPDEAETPAGADAKTRH